ncbi:MAG: hypothetical protein JNM85_07335 [Chthonomonas sp.]|nr:hypothetical protein [Chthonomonas sp.]
MRSLVLFVSSLMMLLALAGCGGSGGASGGGGGVTYQVQLNVIWTGGADPTGNSVQSMIFDLMSPEGLTVESRILNRADGNVLTLDTVPTGSYVVRARAYPITAGNGTLLLESLLTINVNGPVTEQFRIGDAPTSVIVTPSGVMLTRLQSKQFFATARSGSANILVSPTAFTWSALGGIGTINATGLFSAETVGTGSVRATYAAELSGATPVTVTERVVTTTPWTILVYMNAANDLFEFSDLNVDQMERVANNPNVRFVVQWKQSRALFPSSTFDGTRRLEVTPNTAAGVQSNVVQDMGSGVDMGIPQTLKSFIQWGMQNYPATRTALVVWNHGRGWKRGAEDAVRSVSEDWESGNQIQIWELGQALQGQGIEILAWDASLMQMLEVAYEIKDDVKYVAGSEESPPGEGYPYDLVFAPWVANPSDTTANLSKGFVDGMNNYAPYNPRKITQSVIRTNQLGNLATAVDGLASALIANLSTMTTITPNVRNAAKSYSPTSTRYYRDLSDLCRLYLADAGTPLAVKSAATNVQTALTAAVVWEGHNSNSANSNGLSIDFSPNNKFSSYSTDYRQMRFAADTLWDEFLLQTP